MNRSVLMRPMDAAAAAGMLAVQSCATCGAIQYPPRELCQVCLAGEMVWDVVEGVGGEVMATTILHHSHEASVRPLLPLRIGLVRMAAGPMAVCFVPDAVVGAKVWLGAALDAEGRAVMTARVVA